MSEGNGRNRPVTTTDAGIPVSSDEHSLTVGPNGPIVAHDHYLIEQMANFNRERIPERQPHAKGSGAFGHFEVNKDVSKYTKADFLQPGKKTDVLIRFSTVAGERGSPDTWRDPRGFSVKFYTEEGNFDMVGNNTPVFFIRDPMKFQHFIRSQKRRSDTNLRDHDMQWDFWSLSPESAHQVTWLMGDRGIPASWRHMNGYSSHTYMWVNAEGKRFWVKYHFKTDQGIKCLTQEQADEMCGIDNDYHTRDLHDAIERGDYPSWTLNMQIMPFEDAETYHYNPFDLTKIWPHEDYPLIEVGKLTLDRNFTDYHTEIEQAAFEPNNQVPGTGFSPDKMLLARVFSYADAHRARLGVNYKQIPVNAPQAPVHSYTKDGAMRVQKVSDPVYAPNTKGGPAADPERYPEAGTWETEGEFVRAAYTKRRDDDDFGQAGTLWREILDDEARERMVSNIVGHASNGDLEEPMKERVVEYWTNVDPDLGSRVAEGLGVQAATASKK
jgi:catalase